MSVQSLRLIAVAALTAGAVACASVNHTTADHTAANARLPGKAACFVLANFDGSWTVLNDTTLIVYAPNPRNAYLIKLFAPVIGLSFHQALGFEDVEHTGEICNNSQDSLVLRDYEPRQIPIIAVHQLTSAEQRQLLKNAGKGAPSKR